MMLHLIFNFGNKSFNFLVKNLHYFILNSEEYLYEKQLIPSMKTFKTIIYQDYLQKLSIENKNITFNKYRLGLI